MIVTVNVVVNRLIHKYNVYVSVEIKHEQGQEKILADKCKGILSHS